MLKDKKLEAEGFYKDILRVSKARTHWAINVMGLSLPSPLPFFVYLFIYFNTKLSKTMSHM